MITPLHSDSGPKVTRIRDTSAQDIAVDPAPAQKRRRYKMIGIGAGVLLLLIVIAFVVRNWLAAEISVPIERVRIAEVTRGPFVRDISSQGTVVAAVIVICAVALLTTARSTPSAQSG